MSKKQMYAKRLLKNLEEGIESFIHTRGIIKFKIDEKENKMREYEITYKYECRILSYFRTLYIINQNDSHNYNTVNLMKTELNIQNQKINRLKVALTRNENTIEYFRKALLEKINELKSIIKIENNITDSLPLYKDINYIILEYYHSTF